MTKEEKYAYWLELAQYDLDTAAAMFSSGRWFYVVFMCQQAIEKLCKGLYTLQANKQISKNEAELLLTKSKEVFSWLLTLKPSTE